MSITYSDLIFTNYPDACDSYEYMSDLTTDLIALVSQYELLINSKKFTEAAQLLADNPSLNRIYFNAEKYNKIIDSIKAVQRLYFSDIQNYIEELITYRGEYSKQISYKKYDVVKYTDSLVYMCTSSNCPMGTLPTNTDYFIQLCIVGEKGESGTGLTPRGVWNDSTQYYTDDLVAYNNVLWAAGSDNIKSQPSDDSTVWYEVLSLNIIFNNIKITNSEIDDIVNGTAELKDDETGTA